MVGVLLAKGIADLSFGGALLWYVVKYIVSAALLPSQRLCWESACAKIKTQRQSS